MVKFLREYQQAMAPNKALTKFQPTHKQEPNTVPWRTAVKSSRLLSTHFYFTHESWEPSCMSTFFKNELDATGLGCYAHARNHASSKGMPWPACLRNGSKSPSKAICSHHTDLTALRAIDGAAPQQPTEQASTKTVLRVHTGGTQKHFVYYNALYEYHDYRLLAKKKAFSLDQSQQLWPLV